MTWQLDTAARTLWQEARGEPDDGRRAVAHVLWNRVNDGRWGRSLASVCLWRAQFSGWYVPADPNFKAACELSDADPLLNTLRDIIAAANGVPDLTGGALFYYSLSLKTPPNWSKTMVFKGQFGHQRFFSDKGAPLIS